MTHKDNIAAWLGEPGSPTRDACDRLLGQVADMRADNVVYPEQDAILRALELCGPTDTRVVILGQDPYHEPGQAMGLSFSVPEGCRLRFATCTRSLRPTSAARCLRRVT